MQCMPAGKGCLSPPLRDRAPNFCLVRDDLFLRASFERALQSRGQHAMAGRRYALQIVAQTRDAPPSA